ncbi:MAG: hypothetical protein M0R30_04750 [Methanoregula sp.]|jgi:hypothetical protein|uniref:hypothetical protein n=1 Tax=Methanoregula sp. TaxID=2052170 RepID=UPI0025E98EA5|nr:hypothetical protein [Methanoregula sp.]MCK9630930.1 hypothetical protein [Methanoregula sp.]
MDDIIQYGMKIILALFMATVVFLCVVACLIIVELQALAAGDAGFILASIAGVLLACAGYIGTGFWLRRTGRI